MIAERPWVTCRTATCPHTAEHPVHEHPGGIADALVETEGDQA